MIKSKILRLKPSAKDKRRYLLIDEVDNKKIEAAILKYLGVLGFAKAKYMKISGEQPKGKVVGSCVRGELENVRAALTLSSIKIERVSNTIRALGKD
jgi:RNase P/RNase MRP subunit POP5